MEETQRLIAALKGQLRARGITYAVLARRIGLSESSVKRLLTRGTLTLPRLERICKVLHISLADLVRSAAGARNAASPSISLEQERTLARNPQLLACFYLLLNGRTLDECAARLALSQRALMEAIDGLREAGLLTGRAGKPHVTLRPPITWRADGPVRKLYERQVRAEFLLSDFKASGESLTFHSAELSAASIQVLSRKLERLQADFAELAELDASLSTRQKSSIAMLVALRPWVFSMFSNYSAKAQRS